MDDSVLFDPIAIIFKFQMLLMSRAFSAETGLLVIAQWCTDMHPRIRVQRSKKSCYGAVRA